MASEMQQLIPMFNGEDYEPWRIKMKTLLMARDLWDVVESGVPEEPSEAPQSVATKQNLHQSAEEGDAATESAKWKDLKLKDMSALHILQMAVTDVIFFKIGRASSSKQAWELLNSNFQESERSWCFKLNSFRLEYQGMRMGKNETINEYTSKVMRLVNRMQFYGDGILDIEVVMRLLTTLPSRFDKAVSSIRVLNAELGKLTIAELILTLRYFELKLRIDEEEKESPQASGEGVEHSNYVEQGLGNYNTDASGYEKWCSFCRNQNHNTSECYSKYKRAKR